MKADNLWLATLFFLTASFTTGRFAIFTNGGNGNGVWNILFWFFCTGLFFFSSRLFARWVDFQNPWKIMLISGLTFLGFVSSSVIGLMGLLGLPVLIPYSVFVIIMLLIVKIKAWKMKKSFTRADESSREKFP